MNIDELHRLATWYQGQHSELIGRYTALLNLISHNASQPDKRPIEAELNQLADFLADQSFDELSIEQLKVLKSLGVLANIGQEGAANVNAVVRTADYDPATAVRRLSEAVQAVNRARDVLALYDEAVKNLGFGSDDAEASGNLITIRVGFQNDVAINNVTEWKDSSKQWYDIIRGLSMACGEKPEDVKVIGTANGSIILILAATAACTLLLAQISKNITSVAKDIIGVRVAIENMRQQGLLTKVMAEEFKRIEKEKEDGAMSAIQKLLADKLKRKDGEINTALTNSIKKLLTFSEKGGTVDFVSPKEGDEPEDGDADDGGLKTALIEVREAIREYQGERESLKLLADGTKGAVS